LFGEWVDYGDHAAFPISRDPPEGGTLRSPPPDDGRPVLGFPISRDPPEGGTSTQLSR